MFAAGRARYIMFLDKILHLLLAPAVHGAVQRHALFRNIIFNDLIRAESLMTFLTVHQRIGEAAQMAAGYPGLRIHQDRAVHTHIVGALHHELLPPCLLDIILKFHTQIAEIPRIRQPAVNLGTGVHKPSRFR